MKYPKSFLWGAATSSHQVEGNNTNNDWWQWEQSGKIKYSSAAATDHYNRFEEDFQIAADLGHNAHRFSVEWSRVEPRPGQFDSKAIEHYSKVIAALKARAITPLVTLHHFTNPVWFADIGGWMNAKAAEYYANYVKEITAALGQGVRYWMTINEPMVYALYSYAEGLWPPGERSFRMGFRVVNNMIQAHRRAYWAIHDIYRRHGWETPMVGFAKNVRPFLVCPLKHNPFCRLGVLWRNAYFNRYFLNSVASSLDFIGVNYYELEYDSTDPKLPHGLLGGNCTHQHKHLEHMNQLGWGLFPEGLGIAFRWLARYRKPILVSENGTCEFDDIWRQRFIEAHIKEMDSAIAKGTNIIGYCYWSLLDNFEWHHGPSVRFGLVDVNYETFERTVRPSARRYKALIQERQG